MNRNSIGWGVYRELFPGQGEHIETMLQLTKQILLDLQGPCPFTAGQRLNQDRYPARDPMPKGKASQAKRHFLLWRPHLDHTLLCHWSCFLAREDFKWDRILPRDLLRFSYAMAETFREILGAAARRAVGLRWAQYPRRGTTHVWTNRADS